MVSQNSRRGFLAAAGVAALAGCLGGGSSTPPNGGGGSTGGDGTDSPTTSAETDTVTGSGPPLADATLPLPMSGEDLRSEARSGGPPKDGIPAIDDPSFESAEAAAERLQDGDVVFGLARNGVAKAYPQNILVWHEITNDVIDGDPVSVTYCPLTGTAQGFARGDTTLGVSGRLLNNNLIMYDRSTENWWPQVLATAIPGPWNSNLAGRTLREFRVVWTTWDAWRSQYPETEVLSTDTGYARNYDSDPYGSYNPRGGYYESSNTLFPRLNEDDRFEPKHVVLGVRSPDGAAATPKRLLRQQGLIEGAIESTPLLWAYDPDLDTGYAYWNPDGLEFDFRGDVIAGPDENHHPAELPLERALTFDAMWFAWSGFYPETSVHG